MQKARVHQVAKRIDKPRETEDWPRVATTVASRDQWPVASRDRRRGSRPASRDVSSALECEKMP